MSRASRRIVSLIAVTVAAMAFWSGPSAAAPLPGPAPIAIAPPPAVTLPPEFDDFYRPAAALVAATPPGHVLRARQIWPAFFGVLQMSVNAWQLLYRTTDSHGHAIATVTTVLVPRAAAPAGGRKLLSYQLAEDSAAQYCAPSYVVQSGSIPVDYVNAAEILIPVATGLGQGWTVAIPDYEGPNSAYGASRMNAQATLDGVRAVESFAPAELSGAKTPTALWGYSGGTIPTAFAAEIIRSYAAELNIVGVAAGGVAPADYTELVRHNNGGLYAGLISGAFVGLATEYPDMQAALRAHVDPLGQLMLASKHVLCHPQGTGLFPGFNYLGSFGAIDPFGIPAIRHAIADNSLGQHVPSVPVYFYHAQNDEIIPNEGTDRVVAQYCHEGAPSVTYVRELLAEHISGVVTHLPGAFLWIRDRLNGIPAPRGCTVTSPVTTITEPQFAKGLALILPPMAQALAGYAIGTGR